MDTHDPCIDPFVLTPSLYLYSESGRTAAEGTEEGMKVLPSLVPLRSFKMLSK